MNKRKALGKGLDALIPQAPAQFEAPPRSGTGAASGRGEPLLCPIEQIVPGRHQPRKRFDEKGLLELAQSIKEEGVLQPLLVRPREGKAGRFELVAGERRWRAAQRAGLKEVPIIVRKLDDSKALEISLVENLQREDLNPIEEAEGFRRMTEDFGYSQEQVAERVGKARATVANSLRLLSLDAEIQGYIAKNLLSVGHAKVLLALTDAKEQVLLSRKCVTDGLTVRALERLLARRQQARSGDKRVPQADIPASHLKHLSDKLHSRFSTSVRLTPSMTYANGKRAKGRIEIDFFDNDDLDRLLGILGVEVD